MKIDFLSSDFEKYLGSKLQGREITEETIAEIEEISLSAFDYQDRKNDYDFRDFEKLPNLKYIHLNNFIIKNYQTNEINRCKNLKGLQFTNCTLKSKSRLQREVETVVFEHCKGFKNQYVSLLRNTKINTSL